ncbi:MAG: 3-phosphoshikimate 1-carboxyvinyltransferase [Oscillospiraceae bacterium]|nr:3-phosphoshikimate 1-carboxyvinyltransferase [Oscillospiraceae bacterium]
MSTNDFYAVAPICKPVDCVLEVPGSKSITNRALLLASMAKGKSILTNVLFSDDSRGLINCLKALGYEMKIHENEKKIELYGGFPKEKATVNVKSAGTSARFLTAMLSACKGEYTIESSEQMKLRPMKPLTDALGKLGCKIEYIEKEGFLSYRLYGEKLEGGEIGIESEQSSQFTSALLMTGCLHKKDLTIQPTGKETAKSYIGITLKMMEQFGVHASRTDGGGYLVKAGQKYIPRAYGIEPDISSACYFYSAAALTGGAVLVKGVYSSSMQGDIKYLEILKKLGCTVSETDEGILVKGPKRGIYEGIDVDMNDCSDQAITLAVLAPFACSLTVIRNIRHIKYQESDRIRAVLTQLSKMGIKCEETADGMAIYPGIPKPSIMVETYDDHRMAMAFALIGLRTKGIKIANPSCTAKTFENYFEVFERLYT